MTDGAPGNSGSWGGVCGSGEWREGGVGGREGKGSKIGIGLRKDREPEEEYGKRRSGENVE